LDSILFTGDTLFVGRTGRVISAKSDIAALYDSVYNKILTMDGNTRIYPGHDYGEEPTVTLKENIKISHLLQARNLKDFEQRMDEFENTRKPGS
jgi:glyoxylase-like metal-dependent hydrolase (beta-lactamase superfamily II)